MGGAVPEGNEVYYKVRDVVRQRGHSETESCRIYKDWHVELRVGSGHVSVWTSAGMVYLTMLERPVYYRSGPWEEHLSRLHSGRPLVKPAVDLRDLLRAQALAGEADERTDEEGEAVPAHANGDGALESRDGSPFAEANVAKSTAVDDLDEGDRLDRAVAAESEHPANGSDPPGGPPKSGWPGESKDQQLVRETVFSDAVVVIDEDDLPE